MWEIIRSFGLYILSVISLICFYWHSVWAEWLLTKLSITGGPSVQSDGFTLHHAVQERFSVLSQRGTGPVLFCLCKIYLTVLFCLCQIFLTIHIVFTKDLIVRMLQCLGFFRFNIFIYLFFCGIVLLEFEYGAQSDQQDPVRNFLTSIESHQAEHEG